MDGSSSYFNEYLNASRFTEKLVPKWNRISIRFVISRLFSTYISSRQTCVNRPEDLNISTTFRTLDRFGNLLASGQQTNKININEVLLIGRRMYKNAEHVATEIIMALNSPWGACG